MSTQFVPLLSSFSCYFMSTSSHSACAQEGCAWADLAVLGLHVASCLASSFCRRYAWKSWKFFGRSGANFLLSGHRSDCRSGYSKTLPLCDMAERTTNASGPLVWIASFALVRNRVTVPSVSRQHIRVRKIVWSFKLFTLLDSEKNLHYLRLIQRL